MKPAKAHIATHKNLPVFAPKEVKPEKSYKGYHQLCMVGENIKPGTVVLVSPHKLETALEKARQGGYILRGNGIDSSKQSAKPLPPPLDLPIVPRSGNPGRKVIEVASGIVFKTVKAAAKHFKMSEMSVYTACKKNGSAKGLEFRYVDSN